MAKDTTKQSEHIIKVPIYSIPINEEEMGVLFPSNYEDIIDVIELRLKEFVPITLNNGKKERKTLIESVSHNSHKIGNIPCVLVRCEVADTNLGDTSIDDNGIITLSPYAKVKQINYRFLLYPKIDGLINKRVCKILLLVYDDPYHDSYNACRIATTIVKKILKFRPINQKLDSVIQEISSSLVVPELQITLASNNPTDSGYASSIAQYKVNASSFKKEVINYQSVPKQQAIDLLEDESCGDFDSKEITFTYGKKQLKVRREIVEDLNSIKLTIESIFNASIILQDEEMSRLYEEDFIIEKLKPVLSNFLSNGSIG